MLKQLPSSMIDSTTLKQERDGKPFYYHVKFTVFGELIEVEDDISDLPDIAQKLILGNKKEATIKDLHKGLGNFKYIIPLIALGEFHQPPEWLKPIEIAIQKLQKNIPEEIKKNPNDYISSSWVKELIEDKRYKYTLGIKHSLGFVNFLLEKDVLLSIPSILDHELHLATPPLLENLEQNWKNKKMASTILAVLQKSKHPDAIKLFISTFTDRNKILDLRISAGRALADKNFTTVKQTLFDSLLDNNKWIRIQAIKSLRNFVHEKEVVNHLIVVFNKLNEHQWVRVRAIESLGFTKDNKKVIRLLAEILKTKTNEEICFHTVQALKRINNKDADFVLRQYWY